MDCRAAEDTPETGSAMAGLNVDIDRLGFEEDRCYRVERNWRSETETGPETSRHL